jgi:NAD-dependent deacetylase
MQLATEEGFRADPSLVWRWYAWRRGLVGNAQPNAGHRALAAAEGRFAHFRVITQNVDGLHARAGSTDLIELHGNILRTVCLERCGFEEDRVSRLPGGEPPRCPHCGAWLRPAVVWFGEMLDPAMLQAAAAEAAECEVMLVVGTSGLVYPAAGLPGGARRSGATVITVNPEPTELDGIADISVRGKAAEVLPRLLQPVH